MFTDFFRTNFYKAKKPAIIAINAATPPFAVKEPAPDDVVDEEAAEVVGEAREEAVDAPLVADAVGMLVDAPPVALDAPVALVPPLTPAPPVTLVPLAEPDPEDVVTEALAPEVKVNGTGLGVALGPVRVVPAHSADCKLRAAWRSVGEHCDAMQPPASAWN